MDLTVVIPNLNELMINTTDLSLYDYNLNNFSLVPIQEITSKNVYKKISDQLKKNVSSGKIATKLMDRNEFEYVANITKDLKEGLKNGDISFVVEKITGETKASLRDNKTGKFIKNIDLNKRDIKDLGNLPELAAMQNQLNDISEQLENLNYNIKRVEQGQYNDRYSGFFSSRQLLLESLSIEDKSLQRQVLSAAIQNSNETIAKLMLTLRQDANEFLDFKLKQNVANELEFRIGESLSYLNSTVQLSLITYTVLEEPKALLATMSNYKAFVDQTLLEPIGENTRSVAWKIDNARKDDTVRFNVLAMDISNDMGKLINNNLWLTSEE